MPSRKKDRQAVGIAGVHYVCAELSQKGYAIAPTSRNTKGIDILASTPDGSRTVSIQVKTSGEDQPDDYWQLNEKDEARYSDSLFYVFVHLNRNEREKPDFYVVPSKLVADSVRQDHLRWISEPKKNGKPRKISPHRKFKLEYLKGKSGSYHSNWGKLFAKNHPK